jgi:hypothetical protein
MTFLDVSINAEITVALMLNSWQRYCMKKVKGRTILRQWKALTPQEKLVALGIQAHSGKDGWATVSPGELKETTGGLDYRTIRKATERLEKLGALETSESEKKSKKLYRLHESEAVRKP